MHCLGLSLSAASTLAESEAPRSQIADLCGATWLSCSAVSEADRAGDGLEAPFTVEGGLPQVPEPRPGESDQVRRPDTALNRILHGAGRANRAGNRGTVAAELLIVCAVFPLPAVIAAVTLLIARIQLGFPLPWGS